MSETKGTKIARKRAVIALGIICILLVAGLVLVLFFGSPVDYNGYVSTHSHTDSDYNSLSTQNTNLQNQVNDLTNTLYLDNSTIWVNDQTVNQTAMGYSYWTFSPSYAGYVSVNVLSSTSDLTYVRVIYSSLGVSYDNKTYVGSGGTAVFPVLPTNLVPMAWGIQIGVGNSNLDYGATETVTVTYHY